MTRVVIVGAGIAGLSTAHALLRRGVRPIVVAPDHGMTARGAGIVSAQFGDPDLAALARRSREIVSALVPVQVCGHAQIALSAKSAAALAGLTHVEEGLPQRLASVLEPEFRRSILWAVFDPEDLRLDVRTLLRELRRGVTIRRARVRSIREGVVLTEDGPIETDRIVIATGPQTARWARGFDVRREAARTLRLRGDIPAMFHVVDTGFYARPDGRGRILAGDGSVAAIRREATRTLGPCVRIAGGETGEILVARGGRPVLGRLGETRWLFTALGGDGLALGPAMGEMLAEQICGGRERASALVQERRSR